MANVTLMTTKDGKRFYKIRVSCGRGQPYLSTRWYVPRGWSQKSIDRELAKQVGEFEHKCKTGEIVSRAARKERDALAAAEAAKILTVRQFGEQVFLASKTITLAENTRDSYKRCLDRWIFPRIGDIKMPEVTAAELSAVILALQSEGKAHSSCVKCYAILNSLFKLAFLQDVVSVNPMDRVQRPTPRKAEIKDRGPETCTVDEIRYILDCLENKPLKWRAYVRLLIDTGVRRGEACGLQWRYVDFKNCQITIAGNLCYTPTAGVYLTTPKSGRTRTIDIDPSVMDLLRALQQEQAGKCISQYVFSQEGSPEAMNPQSPSRYFAKFAKRYNVQGLHPHKLRHSYASIAITHGADIASISENLGHADKSTTLRIYSHADAEAKKRASNIYRNALKKEEQA